MRNPVREGLLVWAAVLAGLALAQLIPIRGLTGALAVAAFLWAPLRLLERRDQDAFDAGWRFDKLGADLAWSFGVCALILPLFALGFFSFPSWLARLPLQLRVLLAPYAGGVSLHAIPWTLDLFGQVAGNAAVAFSEEFFYRGYLTLRFEEKLRPVPAALAVAGLFALGHLLTPAPFRLLVFFPALLFAFLRNRTRTIVGASIAHFLCNVSLLLLQASS
ncbi:MAG TPA: CPBP family intramembrane glutamic endopeptidase [Myxococcales bacterium]|nr:CPBP family intramembrane glutamic endopeptidase [Myxococcales bacterium]